MGSETLIRPAPADVAAYILAGGASQRMGESKARLLIGGTAAACHLARGLTPHVRSVWLVAKPDQGLEDLGLPMLYDTTAERALVHGVRAALQAPGPPWRFVCACDMPGVDADILARLWQAAARARAPGSCLRHAERHTPEPVPSLWHADVAARVTPQWGLAAQDWIRAAGLVTSVATPEEAAALGNLNTPDAWRDFRARGQHGTT